MVVGHYVRKYVKNFLKDAFPRTPFLLSLMKKNHVSTLNSNRSDMIRKGVNFSMFLRILCIIDKRARVCDLSSKQA